MSGRVRRFLSSDAAIALAGALIVGLVIITLAR
jgi:hypothetical protein